MEKHSNRWTYSVEKMNELVQGAAIDLERIREFCAQENPPMDQIGELTKEAQSRLAEAQEIRSEEIRRTRRIIANIDDKDLAERTRRDLIDQLLGKGFTFEQKIVLLEMAKNALIRELL